MGSIYAASHALINTVTMRGTSGGDLFGLPRHDVRLLSE